jgi:multisubunit Na+/H+ antiporter MnhC subunit
MDVRDWQPAVRAIAITFVFCLGIVLLGFRQRSRRTNAAMALTAIALLTLTAGIARFHGYAPPVARGAESSKPALARH